jgi:hypothetical protein
MPNAAFFCQKKSSQYLSCGIPLVRQKMASEASEGAHDDATTRAETIKVEANALLSSKDYVGAERLYTQAIELCPQVEAYWTNRALAR